MRRNHPLDAAKYRTERLVEGLKIMELNEAGLPGLTNSEDDWLHMGGNRRARRMNPFREVVHQMKREETVL